MAPQLENQIFKLSDGRLLGFSESGHPQGSPIFCFHSAPGSRLDFGHVEGQEIRANVRLIGVDRPGIGLSTFQPDRKILDWPNDIQELAAHLGLAQYSVLGESAGGPYALACARMIPRETLRGVGVFTGMGPPEVGTAGMNLKQKVSYNLTHWLPSFVKLFTDLAVVPAIQNKDPKAFVQWLEHHSKKLGPKDRAVFEKKGAIEEALTTLKEAFRQGSAGYVYDSRLLTMPWGFEFGDIEGRVRLWHGTADTHAPVAMARYIAARLKEPTLKEWEGETHLSPGHEHFEDALEELLQDV